MLFHSNGNDDKVGKSFPIEEKDLQMMGEED